MSQKALSILLKMTWYLHFSTYSYYKLDAYETQVYFVHLRASKKTAVI